MAGLKADWGVTPEQVVDVLALTGDTSDNIPGVPGIGLKTASKLLEEFGDLENLLANIDKVSGAKRKENLRDHAETARLARRLVVLLAKTCRSSSTGRRSGRPPPDLKALKALCIECGFHRFLTELAEEEKPAEAAWKSETRVVDTPEAFRAFVAELERQPKFALDTETTAVDPLRADLVGLSFCWEAGRGLLPARSAGPMPGARLARPSTRRSKGSAPR